jgi:hypothetical protein
MGLSIELVHLGRITHNQTHLPLLSPLVRIDWAWDDAVIMGL